MRITDALRERDRGFNPQDLNSQLGRLARCGKITRAEYDAGIAWRNIYLGYLQSIGAPSPYGSGDDAIEMSDEDCEKFARQHKTGCNLLISLGKRVFHAVYSVAVYEDCDLGDPEFTADAAKIGLAALARGFA